MEIEEIRKQLKYLTDKYKEATLRQNLGKAKVFGCEEEMRQKMIGQPCPNCDKIMEKNGIYRPTIDHIIPRSILRSFGMDVSEDLWLDNLEVVCRPCNQFKAGDIDLKNPKTKGLLQELINKI